MKYVEKLQINTYDYITFRFVYLVEKSQAKY